MDAWWMPLVALSATAVPLLLAWWLLGKSERRPREERPRRRGKMPLG